jgi:hypothetical protein
VLTTARGRAAGNGTILGLLYERELCASAIYVCSKPANEPSKTFLAIFGQQDPSPLSPCSLPLGKSISTCCGQLDEALGGGVHCGRVTEFCGEPGIGKTQIGCASCRHLAQALQAVSNSNQAHKTCVCPYLPGFSSLSMPSCQMLSVVPKAQQLISVSKG